MVCGVSQSVSRLGAVKVDVPPAAIALLPDAGFLEGLGRRRSVRICALRQVDIGYDRNVSHDTHIWCDQCRLPPPAKAAEIEVELVKGKPGDQLSPRFGLKGGQRRIAQLLIRSPIAGGNGVEEFLG